MDTKTNVFINDWQTPGKRHRRVARRKKPTRTHQNDVGAVCIQKEAVNQDAQLAKRNIFLDFTQQCRDNIIYSQRRWYWHCAICSFLGDFFTHNMRFLIKTVPEAMLNINSSRKLLSDGSWECMYEDPDHEMPTTTRLLLDVIMDPDVDEFLQYLVYNFPFRQWRMCCEY